MPATVTLDYDCDFGLVQNPVNFSARVVAVDVYDGSNPLTNILAILGMTVSSDTTSLVGTILRRRIVLATSALGDQLYPNAVALRDATRNLFRAALSMRLPCLVTAAEPVVT